MSRNLQQEHKKVTESAKKRNGLSTKKQGAFLLRFAKAVKTALFKAGKGRRGQRWEAGAAEGTQVLQ